MNVQIKDKAEERDIFINQCSFLDSLFNNSQMTAIFILNKDGKIVRMNEGVFRFYGYIPEDLMGKNISVIYTQEDILNEIPNKILLSVLEKGSVSDFHYTIQKDGTPIWSHCETLYIKNNNDIYFIKIIHDVDEVKLLEENLIASEKTQTLLSAIFDSFSNGIEVFRSTRSPDNEIIDFEFIIVNKTAAKFMNRPRKDIAGKRMLETYPDLKYNGVFDIQKRSVESGKKEAIEFFYDKQGLNGWFKAYFVKFGDGVIATIEDISESKFTNTELKKTKSFLKDSQEIAKVGTLEWDIRNDKITGTPALYRLLGLEKEKITLNDYLINICDEDRERVKYAIQNSMHSNLPTQIEYKFKISDGSVKTFFVKAQTLFDENDHPTKMIGTIADITKLKNTESALKNAEEELSKVTSDQKIVNKRTEDLAFANKQLKKIIEELDNYAYIISHDLRAPLNSLEGLINLIGEDYKAKPLDSYGEEIMNLIYLKIHNMKEMIIQVLQTAKADKKIKEPINIYSLTTEVINTLNPPSNFKIEIDKRMPNVKYHRTSLIQIFQNLIGNAIKYMNKAKPLIRISSFEHHTCYEISISDNGIGISKSKISKIFNLYEVGHENINIESHGLGLSIAKKLIEENGGRIWVESEEGKGTVFRFTILKEEYENV